MGGGHPAQAMPQTGTARQAALILAVNAGVGLLLWAWLRRTGRRVTIVLIGLLLLASVAVGLAWPDVVFVSGLNGSVTQTPFRLVFTACAALALVGVMMVGIGRSPLTAAPAPTEGDDDPRLLWKRLDQGIDPSASGDERPDPPQ
ncbi:MAG: hypothetical protein IPL43_04935 [Micropruina sp.]|nr:hypothetical protein [Micropruina sp.]